MRRICSELGSYPKFLLCYATIANPKEQAANLTGLNVELVNIDASPSVSKHFIFWNSASDNQDLGIRKSANSESARLMSELLKRRIRTINFVRSRNQSEIVSLYTKNHLLGTRLSESRKIASYHGNYLPSDRRDIESRLVEDQLLGLVSTNDMELGVDIGNLDATIITGFPGSVSSLWQQCGHSGRGEQESLTILVASNDPIDQYVMRYPETFLEKANEHVLMSPTNPHIQKPHLIYSAYEMPISMDDIKFFGTEMLWSVDELTQSGFRKTKFSKWFLSPDVQYHASEVNIRSIGAVTYVLVNQSTGAVFETVDETTVLKDLYPDALHLHQGESFLITEIDFYSNSIYCAKYTGSYYTQAKILTDIRVKKTLDRRIAGNTMVHLGITNISFDVISFKRIHKYSHEVLSEEKLTLPNTNFDTKETWFDVSEDVLKLVESFGLNPLGDLHGVEHTAMGVLPHVCYVPWR